MQKTDGKKRLLGVTKKLFSLAMLGIVLFHSGCCSTEIKTKDWCDSIFKPYGHGVPAPEPMNIVTARKHAEAVKDSYTSMANGQNTMRGTVKNALIIASGVFLYKSLSGGSESTLLKLGASTGTGYALLSSSGSLSRIEAYRLGAARVGEVTALVSHLPNSDAKSKFDAAELKKKDLVKAIIAFKSALNADRSVLTEALPEELRDGKYWDEMIATIDEEWKEAHTAYKVSSNADRRIAAALWGVIGRIEASVNEKVQASMITDGKLKELLKTLEPLTVKDANLAEGDAVLPALATPRAVTSQKSRKKTPGEEAYDTIRTLQREWTVARQDLEVSIDAFTKSLNETTSLLTDFRAELKMSKPITALNAPKKVTLKKGDAPVVRKITLGGGTPDKDISAVASAIPGNCEVSHRTYKQHDYAVLEITVSEGSSAGTNSAIFELRSGEIGATVELEIEVTE